MAKRKKRGGVGRNGKRGMGKENQGQGGGDDLNRKDSTGVCPILKESGGTEGGVLNGGCSVRRKSSLEARKKIMRINAGEEDGVLWNGEEKRKTKRRRVAWGNKSKEVNGEEEKERQEDPKKKKANQQRKGKQGDKRLTGKRKVVRAEGTTHKKLIRDENVISLVAKIEFFLMCVFGFLMISLLQMFWLIFSRLMIVSL